MSIIRKRYKGEPQINGFRRDVLVYKDRIVTENVRDTSYIEARSSAIASQYSEENVHWAFRTARDSTPHDIDLWDGETIRDNGEPSYDSDEYETADNYPSNINPETLLFGEPNESPWLPEIVNIFCT